MPFPGAQTESKCPLPVVLEGNGIDLIQIKKLKMSLTELETFVKKFHQLWNDGVSAHLDHGGDAWVGLRVRLGQVPGPLHRQVHPFHQEVPRKESPSCQRRCARRAAARNANVDRATNTEAEEANKVAQQTSQEQTVTDDAGDATVVQIAEEPVVQVNGV